MSKENDTLPPEANKRKATLAALEAERNRRTTQKLESGELQVKVIGVPADAPEAAVNDDPDPEAPITTIVTGVPRNPDFAKWKHEPVLAQYPDRYAATLARAPRPPAKPPTVASEWRPFYVTITPPSERDMGMIIEARYAIAGGELRLDFQGKLYAEALGPNDDPLVVARRLLRSKYGRHEEFYGRINYPPHSIH
jgi:hypothetical protein